MIISLELVTFSNAITVDVDVYDNSATAYVTIVQQSCDTCKLDLIIYGGQKIVLAESDKIAVTSSASASLNAIASILEAYLNHAKYVGAQPRVSGNRIDGGTITTFASTGIDDNATATKVAVTDATTYTCK